MTALIKSLNNLRKSKISKTINKRLKEFQVLGRKRNIEWFCELCFCILTANSKASTALRIQEELKANGFLHDSQESICKCIERNKHRFHNNKAMFIVAARKHNKIKSIIKKLIKAGNEPREWLVKNVKGVGWKESSHFLRNVGFDEYAILDRHILKLMFENKIINSIPKTLTKKDYLEIENKFKNLANTSNMNSAELDLYMWYMKTGKVLK